MLFYVYLWVISLRSLLEQVLVSWKRLLELSCISTTSGQSSAKVTLPVASRNSRYSRSSKSRYRLKVQWYFRKFVNDLRFGQPVFDRVETFLHELGAFVGNFVDFDASIRWRSGLTDKAVQSAILGLLKSQPPIEIVASKLQSENPIDLTPSQAEPN